ncbi:RNA binding protein [Auricularia subglabra TFB-10046 SS5]|nr:RNA binding protein [Auricularia subglabra TFB-10046 SS5]
MQYVAPTPVHRVLCADCGTPIEPNSANLCVACLRNTVDITEGIPKQSALSFCKNCNRFLSPPSAWTIAEPESRELLALCLKKLKGLNKVRLVDAAFVWTEPHSKRLKVKLTIQKEVFAGTILQQVFVVEYIVQHGQCPDCARLAAKNTWKALVQVRQKVAHKRTFLFLEQLILKHGAQKDTISVKEVKDGLDFFYAQRSHAIKMVEFLAGVVPTRTKGSEQLLGHDTHSNVSNYKFTYSVEIAPLCKDDLVCLPMPIARSLSNIHPLTVCTRIGNSIHLLDPSTLQSAELSAQVYFRSPVDPLANISSLREFTILDIEPTGLTRGKWVLADAQVALGSAFRSHAAAGAEDDYMMDDGEAGGDGIYHTRTHLGGILQPGDTALGYFLTRANYNSDAFSALQSSASGTIPDIVLVKKTYPARRKKTRARQWRLKSIAKEAGDTGAEGVVGRMGGRDQKKVDEDYEIFLRDLEEDVEMRAAVNLYKAKPQKPKASAMDVDDAPAPSEDGTGTEADEPDFPDVKLDELLEDMENLGIDDDEEQEEQL